MTELALLDASVGETPARRNFERELPADVRTYKVSEGNLPPDPGAFPHAGAVISGSQTSVYDDHDWIRDIESWARAAHEADLPVLGVCWGHQLLAQALGGRVVAMDDLELGYETVERVAASPLFRGLGWTFTAFETHGDTVAQLPPGARPTARNDTGIQAFQAGRTFGVQFHPEYDLDTARWVVGNKDLPSERERAVRATLTEANHAAAAAARRVFPNFCRILAGESTCSGTVRI